MSDAENQNAPVVPANLMTAEATLPADWQQATLIGRAMTKEGPSVVYVREDGKVVDITHAYATTTDLFEKENPAAEARRAALTGKVIGTADEIIANSSVRDPNKPYLLSPADFQEVEAAGVTFVPSMVERMIEQRVMALKKVEPSTDVDTVRKEMKAALQETMGKDFDFSKVVPGSEDALRLIKALGKAGFSTIYPEVGFGVEGEIFSKAAPGTSVGHGAQSGYSPGAEPWVNPEPEVVMFANSKGKIVGAAHGNDVNDRKKEGQSALLLHRAKVKNGSTSIGPFVRLFDDKFGLNDVKKLSVELKVMRADGTVAFEGANNMEKISRSPESIVAAACDSEREHQQGVAVFLGTMTVPEKDETGKDFTHREGDVVRMGSPQLGYLTNVMLPADKVQGLEKGSLALARNLAERGLLLPQPERKLTPMPTGKILGGGAIGGSARI